MGDYCTSPGKCCWGAWKDDGCDGTSRVYASVIYNAKDWKNACMYTNAGNICPNTPRGALPTGSNIDQMRPASDDCITLSNEWGKIRIPDATCGYAPPPQPRRACLGNSGPYGALRPDIANKGWIDTGTAFALVALNWIPAKGTGWTMIAGDPGRLTTVEQVVPTKYGGRLDTRFLFAVDPTQCASKGIGYLRYGDFVQIRSIPQAQYIRCASGTCSLTSDAGNCSPADWHTFQFKSFNNAKNDGDQVCWGDEVMVRQTVGTHASITAADGGAVWACDQGNCNLNYRMKIVPDSGSVYADPTAETNALDKDRTKYSCLQNPAQPACISKSPWFTAVLVVVLVSVSLFALSQVIRAFRGGGNGGNSGQSVEKIIEVPTAPIAEPAAKPLAEMLKTAKVE